MVKFISILGASLLVLSVVTLLWPRITPRPRPEFLATLHQTIMKTPLGRNAASVLGVSNEAEVLPLTPQGIFEQVTRSIRSRMGDVIITHAVREITKRFRDLPTEEQDKVLEAFSAGISESQVGPSPSKELSQPAENGSNTNNNPGPDQ